MVSTSAWTLLWPGLGFAGLSGEASRKLRTDRLPLDCADVQAYVFYMYPSVRRASSQPAPFSANARTVLERRYLRKDDRGRVVETPDELLWRVASAVAEVDSTRP